MLALGFDFAVEDSLEMAVRLAAEAEIQVALVDRPWNRAVPALPPGVAERIVRCRDWDDVGRAVLRSQAAVEPNRSQAAAEPARPADATKRALRGASG